MTVTSNDIINEAVQYIGNNQPPVTGQAPNFDSSPAGVAAKSFYTAVVQTVGRQHEWDFSRATIPLVLTGNAAPQGWSFEYSYPASAIEIWQVLPSVVADANNPLPTNWAVGNALVSSVQTKVIWSNNAGALVVCNNMPSENTWDPMFREAVVRLLASVLSMAIAGKPDAAQAFLESGSAFESIGEKRSG